MEARCWCGSDESESAVHREVNVLTNWSYLNAEGFRSLRVDTMQKTRYRRDKRSAHRKWSTRWLVFVFFVCFSAQANADEGGRPNILLIVSEDNGQELGCYGDKYVRTPMLDKLASEGVRFHNAYVPQAGCSQSRAAYFTGLYPHQNGQIGLATWKYHLYREDTPNMVRSLKDAGYRTGLIGKLHVNPSSSFPFDFRKVKTSNFARKDLEGYAKAASEFISAGDEPFFLSVNYPDAHRPFLKRVKGLPADPLVGDEVKALPYFGIDTPELREETANYYNCMNRLDTLIGELLAELESSGKEKNTLVIYIGDHGADLLRGKRTSYEGGVRVPMIVKWPGKIIPSEQNALVSTLDLFPTLLEVTRLEPISSLAGRSLTPLFGNNSRVPQHTGQFEWRRYLFTEYHLHSAHNFFPQRTVRNERFKLIENLLPNSVNPGYRFTMERFFEGLQTKVDASEPLIRNAYERMRRPPRFELYDLESDPFEFENLADVEKYSEHFRELKQVLLKWRQDTNDPLLDEKNLMQLKAEVEACFVDGKPEKAQLTHRYAEFFFEE